MIFNLCAEPARRESGSYLTGFLYSIWGSKFVLRQASSKINFTQCTLLFNNGATWQLNTPGHWSKMLVENEFPNVFTSFLGLW